MSKKKIKRKKVVVKQIVKPIVEEIEDDFYDEEYSSTAEEDKRYSEWVYADAGTIKDLCGNTKGKFVSAMLTEYENILEVKVVRQECKLFEGLSIKEQIEYRRNLTPTHVETLKDNEFIHYNSKIIDILGKKID